MTNESRKQGSRKRKLNLPRCGLFQADEVKADSIPWQEHSQHTPPDPATTIAFNCFLCDTCLSSDPASPSFHTAEDVYPQWLQRYFDIASTSTVYGDANSPPYEDILIPCCARCNNEYLSRFETRIATAFRAGFDRLASLRKADIFLWCAKIYYGLFHMDVVPRDPRTKQPLKPRLDPQVLKDLSFLLMLLQGFKMRVIVFGERDPPFSMLLFRLHCGRSPGHYFRVKLVTLFPAIALQLGQIGIISVFDDYGLTEKRFRSLVKGVLIGQILQYRQFWELAGRLFYRSFINPTATSYSVVNGPEDMMLTLDPRADGERPYQPDEEAHWISQLTGAPFDLFWNPRTRSADITLLVQPNGEFNETPFVDESPPIPE